MNKKDQTWYALQRAYARIRLPERIPDSINFRAMCVGTFLNLIVADRLTIKHIP